MIIKTTFSELDETIHKYNGLLEWAEGVEVQQDSETRLAIANYRIQIPELKLALREGTLLSQDGGEDYYYYNPETGETIERHSAPPEDAPWEPDASISLLYSIEELDPEEYIVWSDDSLQGIVYDHLRAKFKKFEDLDNIECIIDSSEFLEDEEKAQEYAKESIESYERELEWM